MAILEEYAKACVGQFLPADSGPPASADDGDLTGQCVTLEKWVFATFTDIPNPFSARGHARYMGATLVRQGLAVEVPASQAAPGDTVCYEYGLYGHTGTLLAGNRLFQQNANTSGAKRRVLADGTVVYSATIVPLYSSLGGVAPKFYRLNSFKEDTKMIVTPQNLKYLYLGIYAENVPDSKLATDSLVGKDYAESTQLMLDYANRNGYAYWQVKPALEAEIQKLQARIVELEAGGGGTLPAGTYIKVNKDQIVEVK